MSNIAKSIADEFSRDNSVNNMLYNIKADKDLRTKFLASFKKDKDLMKELNILLRGDKIKKIVSNINNKL